MSDDILHDIDDVITDWQGSRDSMHWTPESPEPVKGRGEVWIAPAGTGPDDNGWVEITGYLSHEGVGEPLLPLPAECYPPDAEPLPVYRLAPDEIELLASIARDRSWWRRLARWIRRSAR